MLCERCHKSVASEDLSWAFTGGFSPQPTTDAKKICFECYQHLWRFSRERP